MERGGGGANVNGGGVCGRYVLTMAEVMLVVWNVNVRVESPTVEKMFSSSKGFAGAGEGGKKINRWR